ncbi:MAG: hypothetical protein KGQ77_07565 [Betaproteobacteria bacterium]|nr:hypothetical protein [Betaproteobacteria bacterium]
MTHPALRLALLQPALVAEHVAAYAALIGDEVALSAAQLKTRLLLNVGALACMAAATVLAGVAVLLWSAQASTLRWPWLYVAVPAVPLLWGMGLAWLGRDNRPAPSAFATLGKQLATDAELLRRAAAK